MGAGKSDSVRHFIFGRFRLVFLLLVGIGFVHVIAVAECDIRTYDLKIKIKSGKEVFEG